MARYEDNIQNIRLNAPSMGAIGGVAVAVLVALILFASVKYVPAGHVGVLVYFGRVLDQVLPEGTHIANPLAVNHPMSVRTQTLTEQASVPSNEGLIVTLDTSLLFRLDYERANEVYQKIGPDFLRVVVEPNLRSAIRSVTGSYSANALYTGEREAVAHKIAEELAKELAPRGLHVESVLLRDVKLPATVTAAIEAKQQAEQEALRMEFILQREEQEAKRKFIEAKGIRDFNRTVAQGLSRQYLTWKGIEATQNLAESNNTKVIIIGSGSDGLPLILGGAN